MRRDSSRSRCCRQNAAYYKATLELLPEEPRHGGLDLEDDDSGGAADASGAAAAGESKQQSKRRPRSAHIWARVKAILAGSAAARW